MQEIVASGNFVLYVRCLEECGVQGATISIFLNEQFHPDPASSGCTASASRQIAILPSHTIPRSRSFISRMIACCWKTQVSLPCTETSLPSVIVVTEPPPGQLSPVHQQHPRISMSGPELDWGIAAPRIPLPLQVLTRGRSEIRSRTTAFLV
eukprot:18609-Rhodomonas_salina.2